MTELHTVFKYRFIIRDERILIFDTKDQYREVKTVTQEFGADAILLPSEALEISIQGCTTAQQMFFMADQNIQIQLVPTGYTQLQTPPMILMASVPSVLAVTNIAQIFVNNTSGIVTKFIMNGAGV